MKKRIALAIPVFCICLLSALGQGQPQADQYVLPNGLKVFLLVKPTVPIVHAALAVSLGVKNEDDASSGLVHLLEHLILFAGSEKRPAAKKTDDLRCLGGYLNAHTDHDLMSVELSLPAESADLLPDWLREFAFFPKFSDEEVAGEKQILIEETRQLQDNPESAATDLVLQNLFAGHPYGRPIYGQEAMLRQITADKLRQLHHAFFVPGNCALALVGRFDLQEMKRRIAQCFTDLAGDPPRPFIPPAGPPAKRIELTREMDIGNGHLLIGFFAPHVNHADSLAMSLLVHLLGSGRSPLLYSATRGARDLLESLSVRYLPMKRGGAVLIHAIARPGNLKRIKSDLLNFLSRAASLNFSRDDFLPDQQPFVTDYLQGGRNLLLLGSETGLEEGGPLALAYATFMLLNELPLNESFASRVAKVNSGHLRSVCGRYLAGKPYVAVEIVPLPYKKDYGQEKR